MPSPLESYLDGVAQSDASDLHLRVGVRPRSRIDGELVDMEGFDIITYEAMNQLVDGLLTKPQRSRYDQMQEIDLSLSYKTIRIRANVFQDYWGPAVSMRRIPEQIPTLDDLGLPGTLESLAHLRRGLVLVTGATGSGKSSTLAAMIDIINRTYQKHIVVLEDPIEYLHTSQRSVIHQRAMHMDFATFSSGLEDALRQDPDVLLVGELRDLESIRLALTAAEMGMVVYSTLHTLGAAQSIDRIYDVFPAAEQAEIRTMLAHSLEGVVSQVLLKRMDGAGRLPATEVLMCNSGVRNLIREGKTQEITNYIQSGKSQGMQTLSDSLESLVKQRKVDPGEAIYYTGKRDRLEKMLQAQIG